jgi:uncharacterized protein YbgA (DUF1722 family)
MLLKQKYRDRSEGRIPLPTSSHELWAQHKYSVMARGVAEYKRLGSKVAGLRKRDGFEELAGQLVELLHIPPPRAGLRNALQHVWGHVSRYSSVPKRVVASYSLQRYLSEIQKLARENGAPYLLASTAMTDLGAWI